MTGVKDKASSSASSSTNKCRRCDRLSDKDVCVLCEGIIFRERIKLRIRSNQASHAFNKTYVWCTICYAKILESRAQQELGKCSSCS